jgi:alpha-galactosidase
MSSAFWRLDAADQTAVLVSDDGRMPRLLHWGPRLPHQAELMAVRSALQPPLPHGGLDVEETITWIPEPGQGFTDHPGLELISQGQHLYTQLRITQAEPVPTGWRFTLCDHAAGIELQLELTAHPETGVLTAQTQLTNQGPGELQVQSLVTIALQVPSHLTHRMSLSGRWAAEFQPVHEPIGSAAWVQESRVGRSSHHAYPGLLMMTADAKAHAGEVWSAQLEWSGNHRLALQRCRQGGLQFQASELLLPGEVRLQTGQTHRCPAVHLAQSHIGLRDLSLRWHRFIRQAISPSRPGPRRVQFNSWEATYFDHDARRLDHLVRAAAELGVERFVLDDGWFGRRRSDRQGLGDWVPSTVLYPHGLKPLADRCRSLGMQFGLWVEPEGISADSDLFERHPQWVMGLPGRDQPLGRFQYVLNLGLEPVRDHLFHQLQALIRDAGVSYLKWDMNRDMTHASSADGQPAARRHVLGVYELIDRLRATFVDLEIETCASGGARADLGMLRRTDRVWASDCNDPIERQRIQQGFLSLLPPELMGVHVGDTRSHTTHRDASIELRTLNALFGHMGLEADLLKLQAEEKLAIKAAIAAYKDGRTWLHQGRVTPIDAPDPALSVTLGTSADRARGLLTIVAVERPRSGAVQRVRIPDLIPHGLYRIEIDAVWQAPQGLGKALSGLQAAGVLRLHGSTLAQAGLALPLLSPGMGLLIRLNLES